MPRTTEMRGRERAEMRERERAVGVHLCLSLYATLCPRCCLSYLYSPTLHLSSSPRSFSFSPSLHPSAPTPQRPPKPLNYPLHPAPQPSTLEAKLSAAPTKTWNQRSHSPSLPS